MKKSIFTLVELLVVMAVLSILAGLIIPSLRKVHNKTMAIKCLHNLKGIGSATASYLEDNNERYMYGITCSPAQIATANSSSPGFPLPSTAPHELLLRYANYELFICPSDPTPDNFNWWWFHVNPIFNAEGKNEASYMFSAELLWGYSNLYKIYLQYTHVLAPSSWGGYLGWYECR